MVVRVARVLVAVYLPVVLDHVGRGFLAPGYRAPVNDRVEDALE